MVNAIKELTDMSPKPMNSMLEMQPKEEAIKKREQSKSIEVVNVPPTAPIASGILFRNNLVDY